ncbi:MAG: beta-galactosidase [Verrucomicrobia bacterium]|nr:beta-galactosidase [Verrucomicrobiota bacterium]MCH8512522.1 beta-galactosidase [Kiritimatiellia bacterium]
MNPHAPPDPWNGCLRQIHLDFHNSPWIDDLLCDFDATALARRFKAAHVNSVIVFAKCVHGMGYYPSKIVDPHPALSGRDFTGEMIEALHREGIRAPIYTIMGWEENLAQRHPDWLQICEDGSFAQNAFGSDGKAAQPGRFRWLNFLHPDFQDYFEAHLHEVLDRYPCDGLFLDMLVMHPKADWSDHAIAFREKHGLMGRDALTHARYEAAAQAAFADKFTPIIQAKAPQASIFYNAENRLFVDGSLGALARAGQQTHFEIESLPSGMWSYHHFPRVARNLHTRKPWLGMTGRFQKMWGDFGGIKPVPALEYECFRAQAMGGANSVGDQLGPRGTLDEGAYRLIGEVFEQVAAAESFYEGCVPCPQVAIVCPHHPECDEHASTLVEEAMVRLCEEHHYDAALVNDLDEPGEYELLILGEGTPVSSAFQEKITAFVQNGGKLLAVGDSVFQSDGRGWGPFANLRCEGESAFAPAYWRARPDWHEALGTDDRVVYPRGLRIQAPENLEILVDRVAPYFQRSDLKFCSHFQAPPRKEPLGEPAVLRGEGWIHFADLLFTDYRQSANLAASRAFGAAMDSLIGPPATGRGLKSTVRMYPLRRGNDLHLTLLHYLPERKADGADIVAERLGFGGQILRLPPHIRKVIFEPTGEAVTPDNGRLPLPCEEGRLLIRLPNFFRVEYDIS